MYNKVKNIHKKNKDIYSGYGILVTKIEDNKMMSEDISLFVSNDEVEKTKENNEVLKTAFEQLDDKLKNK